MTYDEALPTLYKGLSELGSLRPTHILALRTVRGTIGLVTGEPIGAELAVRLDTILDNLGAWANPKGQRFFTADDLAMLGDVFSSPELLLFPPEGGEWTLPVLHRLVTGTDWISTPEEGPPREGPPRVVFYGVKGGVGRSTAAAVAAYELARSGKNVLLVDLDLESPGLSGILLPPDASFDRASFGIVDFLAETAADPAFADWGRLVSRSPLERAPGVIGTISVVAAAGAGSPNYLEKLSRAYVDLPLPEGRVDGFARRIEKLLDGLVATLDPRPDVLLIDSRSGLHDIAAACLVRLSDLGLLFATDAPQTWGDYGILFDHWRKSPSASRSIRERLQIVQALVPAQKSDADTFLKSAYDLFLTLYDELPPGENDTDAFSFDLKDSEAPHSPWLIRFNSDLLEFDPVQEFTAGETELALGLHRDFLSKLMLWLEDHEAV